MNTQTNPVLIGGTGMSSAVAVEEKPRPFYFYGTQNVEHKGKIITRRVAFAGIHTDNSIRIGKAMCSEKDKFTKKKARQLSSIRATKIPEEVIYLSGEETPVRQFVNHVSKLVNATTNV